MAGVLYDNLFSFILISCLLGGWMAWMTGRACALTWRSRLKAVIFMLPLGAAIRLLHLWTHGGTLLSWQYYCTDTAILIVLCLLGYQYTRTRQMVRQYSWIYQKTSPFSWKEKQ